MPNPSSPVPVDQRLRNGFVDFATKEIERGIGRSFDFVSDPAGFLADTDPAPPTLAFARDATRRVCRAWARGSTPIQGPLADFSYGPLCTPYLQSIGEAPTDPEYSRPFDGGQCPVLYQVFATLNGNDVQVGGQTPLNIRGPLPVPVFSTQVIGTPFPDSTRYQWVFASDPGKVLQFTARSTFVTNPSYRIVGRVDGQPDNCGSLIPDYLPPQTPGVLPPVGPAPIDFPGVGPTPINIEFDPDGNINISLPDLGVDFSVPNPLAGDDTGGEAVTPGEQGTAGTPVIAEGEPAEGEDETRNLIGVLVTITGFPNRANVNFNSQGAYYKGAYYVYMGGDVGLSQHPAAIVKPTQFFYADKGANRWRIEPNLGYTLSVTPYYED